MLTLPDLKEFLAEAERRFPYSTMPKDFKGHHSITSVEGRITLTLWHKGNCYLIIDDGTDPPFGNEAWWNEVVKFVEKRHEQWIISKQH